jgi:nucleotide-binding universal stress UspA family protein
MFTRILYPIKFDEFSLPTLKGLSCFKEAGLQEIILVNIIDTDELSLFAESGHPLDVNQLQARVRKEMEAYAAAFGSDEIGIKIRIETGPVVPKIMEMAEREKVSLIVAGRQKRGVLGELFIGSTTDRIIRRSPVPVFVCKPHFFENLADPMTEVCTRSFPKILYPTDWSPCAERVKPYIPLLHRMGGSELIILHVIDNWYWDGDLEYFAVELSQRLKMENQERIEKLRDEFQKEGLKTSILLVEGRPYEVINRVAMDRDVSLIVLGSHGKGFVEGILWGSVSQRVVEYSEKPVLVVK